MSDQLPTGPAPIPTPNANAQPVFAPSFEDHLREFWLKYSRGIYTVVIVAFVSILAKGAYDWNAARVEKEIAAEYNAAASNDKLRAFASAHADHPLGGAASLRLADDAYTNGQYAEAAKLYQKASTALIEGAFGGRASLGHALSLALAGQKTEGETALNQLLNDSRQLAAVRAEAAYHLASLQLEAGKSDEAAKLLDQVSALAPGSHWAQRAFLKRSALPAS